MQWVLYLSAIIVIPSAVLAIPYYIIHFRDRKKAIDEQETQSELNPISQDMKKKPRKKSKYWLLVLSLLVVSIACFGVWRYINREQTVSPTRISLEFYRRGNNIPYRTVRFSLLDVSTETGTTYTLYAHMGGPADFPLLDKVDFVQTFTPEQISLEGWFETRPDFARERFFTMIAVQRNSAGIITGYSDMATFYRATGEDGGVFGNQNRYFRHWPSSYGMIVASRGNIFGTDPARAGNAMFVDSVNITQSGTGQGQLDWFYLIANGERSTNPVPTSNRPTEPMTFDQYAPEFLVYANTQGLQLPDGTIGNGDYVNRWRFFVVTDYVTNPNWPFMDKWHSFMTDSNGGIMRTPADINSLLP